ncbi:MAG: ligand-binding sensor domain-containing protein, partial [bacterium]
MEKTGPTVLHNFRASLPFLFIASLAAILHAQDHEIKFERIGLEQGLSQNTVHSILQDHQGFLWFGTQVGLNKYDGYNFTVYQHDVFDSTSLSDNVVQSIFEDHTGTLWVGTMRGGLNRFERETEQFTRFAHDPKNPYSLSHNV